MAGGATVALAIIAKSLARRPRGRPPPTNRNVLAPSGTVRTTGLRGGWAWTEGFCAARAARAAMLGCVAGTRFWAGAVALDCVPPAVTCRPAVGGVLEGFVGAAAMTRRLAVGGVLEGFVGIRRVPCAMKNASSLSASRSLLQHAAVCHLCKPAIAVIAVIAGIAVSETAATIAPIPAAQHGWGGIP